MVRKEEGEPQGKGHLACGPAAYKTSWDAQQEGTPETSPGFPRPHMPTPAKMAMLSPDSVALYLFLPERACRGS